MASGHTPEAPLQRSPQLPVESLPVFDDVQDYEKIQRIGEGTYGVVCKLLVQLLRASEGAEPHIHLRFLQTKPSIDSLGRWWL